MEIVILAAQILGEEIGSGGDRVFVEMARRWRAEHRVTVICPGESAAGLARELPGVGLCPLRKLPWSHSRVALNRVYLIPLVYLSRCAGVLLALRRCRGDVLVLSGDFFCNVLPAAWAVRRGRFRLAAANVFHINESVLRRKSNPTLNTFASFLLQRLSFRFIKRYARLVLLLNRQVADRLERMGFAAERLRVVGAGVDAEAIERVPPLAGRGYDAVYFGRLNPTKGCFDLPDIWKAVVQEVPGARLGVIGAGSDAWNARVLEDLDRLGIGGSVDFLGFLPYEAAYGVLKASSILVTPSYEEGWGITICEALVCGLAVVGYDLEIYREVFPGVLETVPPGDRRAFGQRVAGLLRDRERAGSLARAGRALVAKYHWGALAQREVELFRETIRPACVGSIVRVSGLAPHRIVQDLKKEQ